MRAAPLVALLTGCSSWFGLDEPELQGDAAPGIDAAPLCLGEGELVVCVPTPSSTLELPATIDTNNCALTAIVGATEVCVLAGTDVRVMFTTRATGSRPLVVFAVGELRVVGLLDVAAHANTPAPAAADSGQCGVISDGAQSSLGGGGGAGGGFSSQGGRGGAGASGGTAGALASPEVGLPSGLRGGCRGSRGGAGENIQAGLPGGGGGAVYLLAGTSLSIDGIVNASGGGGGGGEGGGGAGGRAGGNGGGSGGLIALWSPTISVAGSLIANGGGGGGGGDVGAIGIAGEDPASAESAALGGPGGGSSGCGAGPGCGGAGAYKSGNGGDGRADVTNAGGGGGGGGLGFIRVVSRQTINGRISPPAIPQ